MKKSISLLICILLFNCKQMQSQVKIVDKFVKEIILKENLDYNIWTIYIDFPKEQSEEGKNIVGELIKQQIHRINSEIKKNNNEYSIIPYSDLEKNDLTSNFKYKDLNKVYFVLTNKNILTPIIIENEKIISFFYGITKQKRNSYPWILNKNTIIE